MLALGLALRRPGNFYLAFMEPNSHAIRRLKLSLEERSHTEGSLKKRHNAESGTILGLLAQSSLQLKEAVRPYSQYKVEQKNHPVNAQNSKILQIFTVLATIFMKQ